MKILARNLSRETTEEELRALFEPFGEIKSLNIVLDEKTGNSKGFGFVEMPNSKDALTAIKKLNDRNLGGNRIRVKVARERGKKA